MKVFFVAKVVSLNRLEQIWLWDVDRPHPEPLWGWKGMGKSWGKKVLILCKINTWFSIILSKPKWIDQYHPLSQHYHWKRTMVKFLVVMRWCWSFFDVMLCRYFENVVKWILSNRTSVLFRERLPSCQCQKVSFKPAPPLQDACGGSPVPAAVVLAQDRPFRHPSLSGSSCWPLQLLP